VSWSKSSVSAWLQCVMVKIVSFSMSRNVKAKIVHFSMAGMCHSKKSSGSECLEDWKMSWSKSSVSAWLECDMVTIVHFSMSEMCNGQNKIVSFGMAVRLEYMVSRKFANEEGRF
jgi:hypothetical protein